MENNNGHLRISLISVKENYLTFAEENNATSQAGLLRKEQLKENISVRLYATVICCMAHTIQVSFAPTFLVI